MVSSYINICKKRKEKKNHSQKKIFVYKLCIFYNEKKGKMTVYPVMKRYNTHVVISCVTHLPHPIFLLPYLVADTGPQCNQFLL